MSYYFSLLYCLSAIGGTVTESYVVYLKSKMKFVSGDLRKVMEFYITVYEERRAFPEFTIVLSQFGLDKSVFSIQDFKATYEDVTIGLKILWNKFTSEIDAIELEALQSDLMAETDITQKRKLLAEYTRKLLASSSTTVTQVIKDKDITMDLLVDENGKEGLVWPVEYLNRELGPIPFGHNVVLLGAPGSFKTTFALNMVFLNSVQRPYNCAYLYLEDLPEAYQKRIFSRFSRSIGDPLPVSLLMQGTQDQKVQDHVNEVLAKYREQSQGSIHYVAVHEFSTEPHIFAVQFGKYIDDNHIDYIVLDYAQRLKVYAPGLGMENPYLNLFLSTITAMSLGSMHCRKFASILLSQLTKEGIRRIEKSRGAASMGDTSEINALERDAQFMLSLYADDDLKSGKLMRYQILKARNGKTYEKPSEIPCDPETAYIGDVVELNSTYSVNSMANIYDNMAGFEL